MGLYLNIKSGKIKKEYNIVNTLKEITTNQFYYIGNSMFLFS